MERHIAHEHEQWHDHEGVVGGRGERNGGQEGQARIPAQDQRHAHHAGEGEGKGKGHTQEEHDQHQRYADGTSSCCTHASISSFFSESEVLPLAAATASPKYFTPSARNSRDSRTFSTEMI